MVIDWCLQNGLTDPKHQICEQKNPRVHQQAAYQLTQALLSCGISLEGDHDYGDPSGQRQ
uniref:Uncharacterized protein n=1 Tax=Rhizophora mucronata TaxID=61149 RepID=A0A2P2NPN2_RHIMU